MSLEMHVCSCEGDFNVFPFQSIYLNGIDQSEVSRSAKVVEETVFHVQNQFLSFDLTSSVCCVSSPFIYIESNCSLSGQRDLIRNHLIFKPPLVVNWYRRGVNAIRFSSENDLPINKSMIVTCRHTIPRNFYLRRGYVKLPPIIDGFEIFSDVSPTVEFIEGRQWRSSDGEKESRY